MKDVSEEYPTPKEQMHQHLIQIKNNLILNEMIALKDPSHP